MMMVVGCAAHKRKRIDTRRDDDKDVVEPNIKHFMHPSGVRRNVATHCACV